MASFVNEDTIRPSPHDRALLGAKRARRRLFWPDLPTRESFTIPGETRGFHLKRWTVATVLLAAALYAAALSDQLYDLTSPPALSWHVLLRKLYSIIAFSLLGYTLRRALAEAGRSRALVPCIIIVAAFSALIEVGQYLEGSKEGLGWNAIDALCGALGGALAFVDLAIRRFTAKEPNT